MRPTKLLLLLAATATGLTLPSRSQTVSPPRDACAAVASTRLPCDNGCSLSCLAAIEKLQIAARRACSSDRSSTGLLRDLREGRLLRKLCPQAYTTTLSPPPPSSLPSSSSSSSCTSSIVTPTTTAEVGDTTLTQSLDLPEPSTPSEYPFSGFRTAPAMEATHSHIPTDPDPHPTAPASSAGLFDGLVFDSRPSPSAAMRIAPDADLFIIDDTVSAASVGTEQASATPLSPASYDSGVALGMDFRWPVLGVALAVGVFGACV